MKNIYILLSTLAFFGACTNTNANDISADLQQCQSNIATNQDGGVTSTACINYCNSCVAGADISCTSSMCPNQ